MKRILRAIEGPRSGQVAVVGSRATVGRAADCDVQILHNGVSRHHARLKLTGDDLVLTDLSSDNGTYVNGERVERCVLTPGDVVRVMDTIFRYELLEDRALEAAPMPPDKITSGDSLRRTGPFAVAARPVEAEASAAKRARAATPTPETRAPTGNYQAGTSGTWRRSVEPAARSNPNAVAADLPPLIAPDEPARPVSSRRADPVNTLLRAPRAPLTEPPPVTSGSGMFTRPVAPPSTRSGEASATLRLPSETVEGVATAAATGRYGSDEARAAAQTDADRTVPPAARGGSVAMEYAQRTPQYGTQRGGDARAEPDADAEAASAPPLHDDLGARPGRNRVDAVGTNAARFAVRGGASRRKVATPPSARPLTIHPVTETGEYPPPRVPQTGEYGAADPPEVFPAPVADPPTADVLGAALTARASSADPLDVSADPDGRLALAAVLQYRDFRLRTLRGGSLSSIEQRRFDQLDRYLQRTVPDDNALAAMRRFTRFACELPGELTHDSETAGMSTIAIAVYDIGAGGAKLDVGATTLSVGDMAWLAIDLSGVPDVPVDDASTVLFKARIVWVENAQLGVAFAGAPKYDAVAGP